jgi:hypothetical protein
MGNALAVREPRSHPLARGCDKLGLAVDYSG